MIGVWKLFIVFLKIRCECIGVLKNVICLCLKKWWMWFGY